MKNIWLVLSILLILPRFACSSEDFYECTKQYPETRTISSLLRDNIPEDYFFQTDADYDKIGLIEQDCIGSSGTNARCIPLKVAFENDNIRTSTAKIDSSVNGLFLVINPQSPAKMFVSIPSLLSHLVDYDEYEEALSTAEQDAKLLEQATMFLSEWFGFDDDDSSVKDGSKYFTYNGVHASMDFVVLSSQGEVKREQKYNEKTDTAVIIFEITKQEDRFNECVAKEKNIEKSKKENEKEPGLLMKAFYVLVGWLVVWLSYGH